MGAGLCVEDSEKNTAVRENKEPVYSVTPTKGKIEKWKSTPLIVIRPWKNAECIRPVNEYTRGPWGWSMREIESEIAIMPAMLDRLEIQNFRLLEKINIKTNRLNVLFGPNGAGKSTFLDAIWFIRDCITRGVDIASADRGHGIGALWDGADEGANIKIKLELERTRYEVLFGFASGRIEPFVGEVLYSKERDKQLIDRKTGGDKAFFYHSQSDQTTLITLREPEKLALDRYMDFDDNLPESSDLDGLLRSVHFFQFRHVDLRKLKKAGSETGFHHLLSERCRNLWSVLRNLKDRRGVDERYDTIMEFMKAGFPGFSDLLIEQTGPSTVYASFMETARRGPVQASGVSDGHVQMLICLTALFSEEKECESVLLFDEPEISLHPHALAVLARAFKRAAEKWNRQIFIATHSPVLISQFDAQNILATEMDESGRTTMKRVSEMDEIQDLLEEYAAGSLYMAEMIAAQSKLVFEGKME